MLWNVLLVMKVQMGLWVSSRRSVLVLNTAEKGTVPSGSTVTALGSDTLLEGFSSAS